MRILYIVFLYIISVTSYLLDNADFKSILDELKVIRNEDLQLKKLLEMTNAVVKKIKQQTTEME